MTKKPDADITIQIVETPRIPDIEVRRGESARIEVEGGTAMVLIPDGNLIIVNGGCAHAATEEFIAFTVHKGQPVTVAVPRDYEESQKPIDIWYSVLCMNSGRPYYGEGPASPPRMIVLPSGRRD